MSLSPESNRRRLIAGTCMMLTVPAMLASDAGRVLFDTSTVWPALMLVWVALMGPGILALARLLRARADWVGLAGGASCFVALLAAGKMSAIFQLRAAFASGVDAVPADAVQRAFEAHPILFASTFPLGLLLPLGLMTLGAGLFATRAVGRWSAVALVAGAVFFPIGRALDVVPALVASDVLLGLAWASLGWQVLMRPEIWDAAPRGAEPARHEPVRRHAPSPAP